MNRVLCVVIIVMLVACGVLSLGLNHYRDNAITYKEQRDKKVSELKLANAIITDMQIRQRDVAELDARYSRELADARAENETLRADVAAGRKRGSTPPAPVPCVKPPAPPAWIMQPAPDWQTPLNGIISPSESG